MYGELYRVFMDELSQVYLLFDQLIFENSVVLTTSALWQVLKTL